MPIWRCAARCSAACSRRSPRRPTRGGWSCRRGSPRVCRSWRSTCRPIRTSSRRKSCGSASRSDISEEMARFRAHLAHWKSLADSPEPCGRKLDFLLQEMNREVNTIGSKADGLRVSNLVISAKAELEKMREQVQNVE